MTIASTIITLALSFTVAGGGSKAIPVFPDGAFSEHTVYARQSTVVSVEEQPDGLYLISAEDLSGAAWTWQTSASDCSVGSEALLVLYNSGTGDRIDDDVLIAADFYF